MRDIYERAYRVIRANVSMYRDFRYMYDKQDKLFPITGSHLTNATEIYNVSSRAFQSAMRSYRDSHTIADEQPIIDIIHAVVQVS